MPSKAWSDWVLATSRWTHSANNHNICDLLQLVAFVSVVIPLLVIHPLSEELDRWLRAFFLDCGHVHIVDEDNQLLVISRS